MITLVLKLSVKTLSHTSYLEVQSQRQLCNLSPKHLIIIKILTKLHIRCFSLVVERNVNRDVNQS